MKKERIQKVHIYKKLLNNQYQVIEIYVVE